MFPYNVRNTKANLGFTLPEVIIVLALLSVLAAIGIPNFLQMLRRFQTNLTFEEVRGAIKEAQLQAIRRSTTCSITINQSARTITANGQGCLLNNLNFDNVTRPWPNPSGIRTSRDDGIITFTFQGNTNTLQTIVVFNNNNPQNDNRCLVISNGIGMMRWGIYRNFNLTGRLEADSCENLI